MFDLKTFLIVWGIVTLFTSVYVIPIMICTYGGAFLIGYARGVGFRKWH